MHRLTLVLFATALAACNPASTTSTTTATATETATTTTSTETLPPAPLTEATAAGTWSFDGTCASGDGMTLSPNHEASVDENRSGTWSIDDEGRLIVSTHAVEPGDLENRPLPGSETAYIFITGQDADHLTRTDSTTPITGTRCPTP